MNRFPQLSKTAFAAGVLLPALLAGEALAQTVAEGPVESIVVQGQYLQSNAASAMKLDIPVRDTPFTVSAYSDAFLKSLETQSLQDTYNYMNGVKKAGATAYDLTLRGFKTGGDDKNAIMVDGLPGLTSRYASPPTVGLDHVEVVKGPMSVLYGQIQPGGFINMITKKPQANASRSFSLRAQTFAANDKPKFGQANGLTGSIDMTGPLTEDKKFLYRLIAEVGTRDGFRDDTYDKAAYIAPSLAWNLGASTLLNLAYEHREAKGAFDTGIVVPSPSLNLSAVPSRTTRYQEPDDFRNEIGDSFSGTLSHSFANDIAWNTAFRSVRSHSFDHSHQAQGVSVISATPVVNIPANTPYLVRRVRRLDTDRTYDFIDSNLTGTFQTGPLSHKGIAGLNGGRDTVEENRRTYVSGSGCTGTGGQLTAAQCQSMNITVYNPVHGLIDPAVEAATTGNAADVTSRTDQKFLTNSVGAYVSDLITFTPQWKVSLAGRAVHEKTVTRQLRDRGPNARTSELTSTANKGFVPSAGLIFEPTENVSLYGSYAQSYVPVQAQILNVQGQPGTFTPITGKQVEAGAKAENLFNGKLSGSFALFRIKRTNTTTAATCLATVQVGESCNQQGGAEESKGAELEFNARLLDNWQATVGYSFIDAKLVESLNPVQKGTQLLNAARNSANLWTRYDIPSGAFKGLGVGVGVVYTGDRAGSVPTTAGQSQLRLPAYTTLDLALSYDIGRYAFNLKVANVADKVYYENIGQGTQGVNALFPGAARLVTLSMRTAF